MVNSPFYKSNGILTKVTMVLLLGVYLLIVFWLLYPYKTLIIHNNPVPPVSQDNLVKRGSIAGFHMIWTKITPVGATISRMLVYKKSKEIVVIYSGSSAVPAGEHDRIIVVPIPAWVPPGTVTLRTTYEYQVNPIRHIPISWESQEFEIVD
jgi:hypothetical protein